MSGGAEARTADALLRGGGGRTVLVRVPSPAIAGDDGEQVGLGVLQFQDTELGPVVFRKSSAAELAMEMLVSATAVTEMLGSLEFSSAKVFFAGALGVVVDDETYTIEWVRSSEVFGAVYLYRLGLRGALKLLV